MITLNVAGLICIVALAFLLMLGVKLMQQPAEDVQAKSLLLLLLLCFAALILNQFYGIVGLATQIPHYSFSTVLLVFSIGPVLYAYVRRVTRGFSFHSQVWWPLHLLPAVLIFLYFTPHYLLSAEQKLAFLQSSQARHTVSALYILNYLQLLVYILLSQPYLRAYEQKIEQNFSDIATINLRWLRQVCYGFLVLIALDVVLPLLGIISGALHNVMVVATSLVVSLLAFSALGNSRFNFISATITEESTDKSKYQSSGLREDTAQFYIQKLAKLMQQEQAFRQSDISLRSLALQLNMSAHHLSQILNEQLQQSFYDYINQQRIGYAKQLLLEKQNMPIIDVAIESGYNNKVSFYNSFKRYENLAPSHYRKQQLSLPQ